MPGEGLGDIGGAIVSTESDLLWGLAGSSEVRGDWSGKLRAERSRNELGLIKASVTPSSWGEWYGNDGLPRLYF